MSLGKPDLARPTEPAQPAGPWELGPVGALAFLLLALGAATFGFAHDRASRVPRVPGAGPSGTVTAASTGSFTTPARLNKAMKLIEAKAPKSAKLQSLSVLPSELQGVMVGSDGLGIDLDVTAGMKTTVASSGDGVDGSGIALASVPTGAPQRILNAAEQKFHLHAKNLMTFDLTAAGAGASRSTWTVQFTQPESRNTITAALDGTNVRLTKDH